MPIYFFDSFDGRAMIADPEGQVCLDIEDVRANARDDVRELIVHSLGRNACINHRELRVRDCEGLNVLTLPFRDVLYGR